MTSVWPPFNRRSNPLCPLNLQVCLIRLLSMLHNKFLTIPQERSSLSTVFIRSPQILLSISRPTCPHSLRQLLPSSQSTTATSHFLLYHRTHSTPQSPSLCLSSSPLQFSQLTLSATSLPKKPHAIAVSLFQFSDYWKARKAFYKV